MDKQKRGKKNSPGTFLFYIGFILLFAILRSEGRVPPVILFAAAILIVAGLLVAVAKRQKSSAEARTAARPEPAYRSAVSRPSPAARQTMRPEIWSEADSERDRQRRRMQLDTFLKNGIIDRKEYLAILERHREY